MRLYKQQERTIIEEGLTAKPYSVTATINNSTGDVTLVDDKTGKTWGLHYSQIKNRFGQNIGSNIEEAKKYILENTVFKTVTGGSVTIVKDETNAVGFNETDLVSVVGGKTVGLDPTDLPFTNLTQLNSFAIRNKLFSYPDWWGGHKPNLFIQNGKAVHNIDCDKFFNLSSFTPYYVSPTGSDANSGLSTSLPKATLGSCLTAGAKLVYYMEGVYYRDTFLGTNRTFTDNLIVIGLGNVTLTKGQKNLVWTLGVSNTYSTSRRATENVFDIVNTDTNGYPTRLIKATSQANCEATPGSWYTNGTLVYVHKIDNTIPDNNIIVSIGLSDSILNNSGNLYFKNINFLYLGMSLLGVNSSTTLKIYQQDCKYIYSRESGALTYNSLTLDYFTDAYLVRCYSYNSTRDGLNYHNLGSIACKVTEVDCFVANSGIYDVNTNNQCSTAHEQINILRLNGCYFGGNTHVIADVNVGTKSILIGCELNTGNEQANTIIFTGVDAVLDGCKLFGNKLITEADSANGGVSISNSILEVSATIGSVTITPII